MNHRVTAIDHVQLAMPHGEEERAERFYGDVLGLERLEKPAPLAQRGGCWFSNGDVAIHLGVEEGFRAAKKAHPALLVSDLASLVETLDREGFQTRRDIELAGILRYYVDDPFGNRIELVDGG